MVLLLEIWRSQILLFIIILLYLPASGEDESSVHLLIMLPAPGEDESAAVPGGPEEFPLRL